MKYKRIYNWHLCWLMLLIESLAISKSQMWTLCLLNRTRKLLFQPFIHPDKYHLGCLFPVSTWEIVIISSLDTIRFYHYGRCKRIYFLEFVGWQFQKDRGLNSPNSIFYLQIMLTKSYRYISYNFHDSSLTWTCSFLNKKLSKVFVTYTVNFFQF